MNIEDIKKIDIKTMKSDIIKHIIMFTVMRFLKFNILDKKMNNIITDVIDKDFLYMLLFLMAGLSIYYIFIEPKIRS